MPPHPTREPLSFCGLKGSQDRGVQGPDQAKAEDAWSCLHSWGLLTCGYGRICTRLPVLPGCHKPPGFLPDATSVVRNKAGSPVNGSDKRDRMSLGPAPVAHLRSTLCLVRRWTQVVLWPPSPVPQGPQHKQPECSLTGDELLTTSVCQSKLLGSAWRPEQAHPPFVPSRGPVSLPVSSGRAAAHPGLCLEFLASLQAGVRRKGARTPQTAIPESVKTKAAA